MKFRIEDVLIEPSKIGFMGDGGEKIRMTHKPSGIFVFKESPWMLTHLEKERLLDELKRKVENTPVKKLEVIKPVEPTLVDSMQKQKDEIGKEFMKDVQGLEVEHRVKMMAHVFQLSSIINTLIEHIRNHPKAK